MFATDEREIGDVGRGCVQDPLKPLPKVRRRLLGEVDIEAAATLLNAGFPRRSRTQWLAGLDRLRTREAPDGFPRFGIVLEADGRLVGILLTIYAEVGSEVAPHIRCNFSSWYVEPAFAAYSSLLYAYLLKDKAVTFVNISPASHTRAIVEAQGFAPFRAGWVVTLPWLQPPRRPVRVSRFTGRSAVLGVSESEGRLLEQHAAFGCLCLLVEADDGCHPFVFTSRRRLGRLGPTTYLVYCRDLAAYARFAGPLGRRLLRHGILSVVIDGDKPSLVGRQISRSQAKYVRGPHTPRPGDMAFSEVAIFEH